MASPPPTAPNEQLVALNGRGRVEVAAYGVADAEHLLERELGRLWPEARLRVTDIERVGEESRIAEEFRVSYRLECSVAVRAASPDAARREAFRRARERLAASRYWRTEWEARERGDRR